MKRGKRKPRQAVKNGNWPQKPANNAKRWETMAYADGFNHDRDMAADGCSQQQELRRNLS